MAGSGRTLVAIRRAWMVSYIAGLYALVEVTMSA